MEKLIKFITIGSDPEFFVLDPKGNPYPAVKFTVGTKDNPVPIEGAPGFYEQRDNLSFEGNVPPVKTKEEFIKNVTILRNWFITKISIFGYSLSPNGVEYFAKRYLNLPEGQEFGCSTVISSWHSKIDEFEIRPTPILKNSKFRVSGFHIHIGYINSPYEDKRNTDILIGRLFDIFLTIPSHIIKFEPERLATYGKYGMIRSKSYGVECRTISTYFTQKNYLGWVWDQLMKIEKFIQKASKSDLDKIISESHLVDGPYIIIDRTLTKIFNNFENKKILKDFEETKKYYNE